MRHASIAGGDLLVYFNGELLGIAETFDYAVDYGRKEIRVIDTLLPIEEAPTQVAVGGSFSVWRTDNTAGLEGLGVVARDFALSRERYFSIRVVNRQTDTIVFKCDMASVKNQSWSVQAQGLMKGTFSFSGIGWSADY